MPRSFTADDVPDQSGRTFVVTGANTGLGFETAKVLADRGARVLMACRSRDKALAAMAEISAAVPHADLDFVPLDQGDLASIRAAADRIALEPRLDVLVNNAGIMVPPRELTTDGFESQFGVNHLGTFALTSHLLDMLGEQEESRVVVTSSLAHRGGEIFFDDIDAAKSYRAQQRYQQSKLANLLFTFELDRRLAAAGSDTIAVACHPGIADTELTRHLPSALGLVTPFIRPFIRPFFNSPSAGAWPTLMAATAPVASGGDYFGPSRRMETSGPARKVGAASTSRDRELAARLWDLSIEMTGVDPGI
jgi:NAD(P)-dependent dehydrogenase (short-subunit alcohol dehydrogenase family)